MRTVGTHRVVVVDHEKRNVAGAIIQDMRDGSMMGHGDVVEVSRTVRDVMMAVGGPGNANPVAFVEGRLG